MKPEETLKKTIAYLKNLEKAKRMVVAVGLPKGKASSAIYDNGSTVIDVGASHEFGAGRNPVRSFLRVPFKLKKEVITKGLVVLFRNIIEKGSKAETQLEKAGVMLQNISKESFETKGFGTWQDIKPATKAAKGSTGILMDSGTLRNSITYEVRNK
jgi:hypothetical protein